METIDNSIKTTSHAQLSLKNIQKISKNISTKDDIFFLESQNTEKYLDELRESIKKLKRENLNLTKKLNDSRKISKKLINILYEHGILDKNKSIFSLFKDV